MTKISIFDPIFTTLCQVLNTIYLIAFCARLGMTPKKGPFLTLPQQCVSADLVKLLQAYTDKSGQNQDTILSEKCATRNTVKSNGLSNRFEDTPRYHRQSI